MGCWMEKLYTGKFKQISLSNLTNLLDLSELGWQRGRDGLNPDNLAYKLRADQEHNRLTQRERAYICGIVLEGGSDIVRLAHSLGLSSLGSLCVAGSSCVININHGVRVSYSYQEFHVKKNMKPIISCVCSLISNPDIQKRAQSEIDSLRRRNTSKVG